MQKHTVSAKNLGRGAKSCSSRTRDLTAMGIAVYEGMLAVVTVLICRVRLLRTTGGGTIAVHGAIEQVNDQILRVLFEAGISVDQSIDFVITYPSLAGCMPDIAGVGPIYLAAIDGMLEERQSSSRRGAIRKGRKTRGLSCVCGRVCSGAGFYRDRGADPGNNASAPHCVHDWRECTPRAGFAGSRHRPASASHNYTVLPKSHQPQGTGGS